MKMTELQCVVCLEMMRADTHTRITPVCDACAADVHAPARVQERISSLYELLVDRLSHLDDTDSDRYTNVWLAEQQINAPVVYEPHAASMARAKERAKLMRMLERTMQKDDAVSACMRVKRDITAQIQVLHTLSITQDMEQSA
jgi:hypothetical protein